MRWMWRLTSSEPEIDSLMAVPRYLSNCLIWSSTLGLTIRNAMVSVNFRPPPMGRTLLVPTRVRLQTVGHRIPELSPVGQVLPPSPPGVAAYHREVRNAAALVIALADESSEFGVDGDEIVTAIHRQQMRGTVRTDPR